MIRRFPSRSCALPSRSSASILGGLALLATVPASAAIEFDTLALNSSEAAALNAGPNLGAGVTFGVFHRVHHIDDAGNVLFFADVSGGGFNFGSGLFRSNGTTVQPVAIGDAAGANAGYGPNLSPGISFRFLPLTSVPQATIDPMGRVLFAASTTTPGASTPSHGLWGNDGSGNVPLIAPLAADTDGPGLGAGVYFSGISNPSVASNGGISFGAEARNSSNSINTGGIWNRTGSLNTPVALSGSLGPANNAGPGLGDSVTFSAFGSSSYSAAGNAFDGTLSSGNGVNFTNDKGIWTRYGGSNTLIAREGPDAVALGQGPNLGSGIYFSSFGSTVFDKVVNNERGDVAFRGMLSSFTTDVGLFVNRSGVNQPVAVRGSAGAPGPFGPNLGPNVYFFQFFPNVNSSSRIALNNAGEIAFAASVVGNINGEGIWASAGGTLQPVALTGAAGTAAGYGPGLGENVHFSLLNEPQMNDRGVIVFTAQLAGVSTASSVGLWVYDGDALSMLLRTGDSFDIDPGDGVLLRTIQSIDLTGFNLPSNRNLNNENMIAFRLSFADGGSGIFTAVVPEPGAALLLVATATLRTRRYA